ncbi:MAG: hypothetical protein IKK38_02585 [Spirochaetaceae bacterium]|nr:hypothetical protein [Spirochaetaceae bacterium]
MKQLQLARLECEARLRYNRLMDDKEYYSIKRISSLSVEQLQRNLKKKKLDNTKYRENQLRQGHDDAEMLLEKQQDFDSFDS